MGISTIGRADHSVAQTRELACTKEVLPQVIARGYVSYMYMYVTALVYITTWLLHVGLRVTEVARDIQQQVSRFVTEQGLVNSYAMWHGVYYKYFLCVYT